MMTLKWNGMDWNHNDFLVSGEKANDESLAEDRNY